MISSNIIERISNFIMPVEEEEMTVHEPDPRPFRAQLQVHSQAALRMYVGTPLSFDDVKPLADYLKSRTAVVVNFEGVDDPTKRRICDFLDGVTLVTGGEAVKVSSSAYLYVPPTVDIKRLPFECNLPVYQREK